MLNRYTPTMAATLVTPEWLAKEIKNGNPNLRIFDTTITVTGLGDEEFKSNHIQGAQFLNLFKHTTPTKERPVNLPDLAGFEDYLRSLGVNTTSHVILYENTDQHGFAGPRAWWMLRAYGVKNVSLLDGGLKRWQAEGHLVSHQLEEQPIERGNVTLTVNKNMLMSYDDVITASDVQFVDTRPSENYSGEEEEPSQLLQAFMPALGMKKDGLHLQTGHVPGAVNVPYPSMYQTDEVTFRPKEELIALLKNQGVNFSGRLVGTCYVGLTACIFAVAARVCGLDDVGIYPGSWVEYGQKAPVDRVERTPSQPKSNI